MSGLGLGSGSGESLLSTQLLVDVVTGQLGAEGEQSCAARISRVILAGNLLSQNTQSRDTINKVRWGRGLRPRPCSPGSRLARGVPRRVGREGSEGARGCSLTVSLLSQAKYLTKKTQAASVEAVKMLDEILLQLCVSAWSGIGLAGEWGTFSGRETGSRARGATLCQQPGGAGWQTPLPRPPASL